VLGHPAALAIRNRGAQVIGAEELVEVKALICEPQLGLRSC
jgi:hypothetical protein